ncbi:intracellular hyaluronan-binding protein 4-like isoform X2 [Thalassophryne amazonica]|uniref:intracellular hyaluronan-binding protein 4-like isoform X2 n=1 Tax=Thalassophryne amazonica TaxID=390379 RepID=UPI001470951E|nr:intracellular hyaluronan-binding protein 4-like isoform X2 [Thalassophryne amazonica]
MRKAAVGQYRTNQDQEDYPQESAFSKSRGGTRAGRGQRGGGAGYNRNSENLNLRGKREYDRHSGTGVSPEEKRGGRGPWNWGSVEDTAGELMEVPEVTSNAPYKPEESQSPVDAQIQSPEETDTEMLVHVAMEMTLDEWKALQESSRPKAEFNLRKAESKIPSKARVIHQSKRKENLKGNLEELEEDGSFLRRSVNDITSLMDINFGSLGRPSRGGRGRGAQSGLTGRLERAKPKVEMEGLAPNPDDPEDFPALTG